MEDAIPIQIVGPALVSRALIALLAGDGEIAVVEKEAKVTLLHGRSWKAAAEATPGGTVYALLTDGNEEDLVAAHQQRIRVLIGAEEGVGVFHSALQAAARGEPYCSPTLLSILQERAARGGTEPAAPAPRARLDELTRREREIALAAAQGLSDQQIAVAQCVQITTVKTHLTHVYAKLEIRGRRRLRDFQEALRALCAPASGPNPAPTPPARKRRRKE